MLDKAAALIMAGFVGAVVATAKLCLQPALLTIHNVTIALNLNFLVMKLVLKLLVLLSVFLPSIALARDTHVNGYYRQNGTYVQPHYRTAPNNTKTDNYSYHGNVNPYTGEVGSDY